MKKQITNKSTRIMVFGTFDGIHEGHLNLFKQAKKLAKDSFLIVSVARDVNVFKIKNRKTKFNEKERFLLLKNTELINRVVLSGKTHYLPHILKEKPNIIALGYDQKAYVAELRKDIKNRGLDIKIVRLKAYKPNIYKNHLLKKQK